MSSMNFGLVLGKVLLGLAGMSVAVCAYKLYSSNKDKRVPSSNGENVVPNQPAEIELDGLFIFYVDNKFYHMPVRHEDMEFPADKAIMDCEDGSRLDVHIRSLYEHRFNIFIDDLSRYDGLKLTCCNFKQLRQLVLLLSNKIYISVK